MSSTAVTGWTLRTLNFLLPRRPTMAQGNAQQLLYDCLVTRSQTPRTAVLLSESALLSHSLFPYLPARWTYCTCPWDTKTFSHKKVTKLFLALVFLYYWYSAWLWTAPVWCSECPDDHSQSSSASLHVPGFRMIHLASGYTYTIFTTTTSISFHLQHFSERATTN